MYKYILESVGDINLIALSALVIFFLFFVITAYKVISERDEHIDHMSNLPLEED